MQGTKSLIFGTLHNLFAFFVLNWKGGVILSLRFLIKRLGYTFFMLIFVITINFFLFRMMPGDPLSTMSKEISSDPIARAAVEKKLGLDKPAVEQFFIYAKSLLTFNFGTSFYYNLPVSEVLGKKVSNSMLLALFSVPLGIFFGLLGGVLSSAKRGKKLDLSITSITMVIYAVPSFWLGMLLMMFFGVKLRILPISGMVTAGTSYTSNLEYLKDIALHLFVPALSYMLSIFGSYLLTMRSAMIDVFTEDFVLTARAKGLTEAQVIKRHVIPNAMLPVSTVVVMSLALMFTGAFSIEVLFSWPGMGKLMVESVNRRDYPVMQAINYIIALVIIAANFVIDIVYSYLDPRVRIE